MTEIKIPEHLQHQFDRAKEELGEETYHKHLDVKFGKPVLNFARSMVSKNYLEYKWSKFN